MRNYNRTMSTLKLKTIDDKTSLSLKNDTYSKYM